MKGRSTKRDQTEGIKVRLPQKNVRRLPRIQLLCAKDVILGKNNKEIPSRIESPLRST